MPTYRVLFNISSQKRLSSRKFIRLNDFPSKTLVKLFTTEGNPNGRQTDSKVPLQVATNNKKGADIQNSIFWEFNLVILIFSAHMTVFLELPHGVI